MASGPRTRIYCSVYGCLENSYRNPELSFFNIPKEPEKRAQWVRLISREDLIHKNTTNRVCEKHFNEGDILKSSQTRKSEKAVCKRLKKDILPCLNLPSRPTGDKLTQTELMADTSASQTDQLAKLMSDSSSQTCQIMSDNVTQTADSLSANSPRKRKLKSELKDCQKRLKALEKKQIGEKSQHDMFHELCDRFLSNDLAELVKAQTYLKSNYKGSISPERPHYSSTMPKIELIYFPIKAMGEPCRLLLAYGGEDWEDKRIARDDWPEFKPTTKFGQLPMLVMDGKQYAQSFAIARYLGRKHGLAGASLEEDLVIDQNVEYINDIRAKAASVRYEPDAEYKERKHEEFSKNVYPGMLDKLNQILAENDGHMALGRLTWADFMFAGMYVYLKMMIRTPNLDERYPAFKKLEQTVYSHPKVKKFADSAPTSDY